MFFRIPTIFGVGPHGGFHKNGIYCKSGLQIFIDKAKEGQPIEVFGDPTTNKDLLYVKDLVLGVQNALEQVDSQGFII